MYKIAVGQSTLCPVSLGYEENHNFSMISLKHLTTTCIGPAFYHVL